MTTTTKPETAKYTDCTLYMGGMMGYRKILCKWVEVSVVPYAQYKAAIRLKFLEKGKRKPRGFMLAYKPQATIVRGHATPEPNDWLTAPEKNGPITTRQSVYSACDPRWQTDFVKGALQNCDILADFHGHNSHGN